jgi:hypothetical protein
VALLIFDFSASWHWIFATFAVAGSVFYGLEACAIFSVPNEDRPVPWHVHQFWLNFLGAAVGWVAAWAVLGSVLNCASSPCALSIAPSAVVLFLFAFLGVTGHLPAVLVGLVAGLVGAIDKLVEKLLALIIKP